MTSLELRAGLRLWIEGRDDPEPAEDRGAVNSARAFIVAQGDANLELAIDLFEERAAIREHLGGQPRADAERAALAEAAASAGVSVEGLRRAITEGEER